MPLRQTNAQSVRQRRPLQFRQLSRGRRAISGALSDPPPAVVYRKGSTSKCNAIGEPAIRRRLQILRLLRAVVQVFRRSSDG